MDPLNRLSHTAVDSYHTFSLISGYFSLRSASQKSVGLEPWKSMVESPHDIDHGPLELSFISRNVSIPLNFISLYFIFINKKKVFVHVFFFYIFQNIFFLVTKFFALNALKIVTKSKKLSTQIATIKFYKI